MMEPQLLDIMAVARMVVILAHIFAVIAAGAAIAFGDYAIFGGRCINTRLLHQAGRVVIAALGMLWLTGLIVIWLETRFEWSLLIGQPKLMAKLTVVSLLSLNGVALHHLAFNRLQAVQNHPAQNTKLLVILGAISVVTWLYATFLGLAKPVAPLLGYAGFMALYLALLAAGIATSILLMKPRLVSRLASVSAGNMQTEIRRQDCLE
ncbi:hypothetical protein [Sulfuriferula thiophila]|uniref:hypothetical protein n=1 Tax=Sulfuriferula thiophila TaxID=1781211 RepID=UPI000F605049|nr:hypothetical protein [Sulfuriferula thiophila]